MKKILFIFLFICTATAVAQSPVDSLSILQIQIDQQYQEFNDSIQLLTTEIETQGKEILSLERKINNLSQNLKIQKNSIQQHAELIELLKEENISKNKTLDSIKSIANINTSNIESLANDLGTKIQETQTTTQKGISKLNDNISKNKLYWIIATSVILLLGGLVYWLLGKQISSSKTDVETQIKNTKKSLEEESIRLDNKLIEVLETQLKISQAEQTISNNTDEEIDHSLALKVADEIVRMQKNITRMDEGTKGLKPLVKGIERIQANFAANGYEMVNLLNTEYDERMNIDVINFKEDESLEEGERIITRVIKPQVNYKGQLIQRAQVDVTQN